MRKAHFIGAGVFIAVFSLATLLYRPQPHPSDKALIDHFNRHRADFDQLLTMAHEDKSVRTIYKNEVMMDDFKMWPETTVDEFSTERWNEYQSVFARLREYKISMLHNDPDQIRIIVSIDSLPIEDLQSVIIEKGYAYSLEPPARMVESLDGMGFDTIGTYYRRIDQHWYLYHEQGISKPE